MSDEDVERTGEGEGEDGGDGGKPRKRLSGKRIVLFGVAPLLALALVVGGLFATGILGGAEEDMAEADMGDSVAAEAEPHESVFYDLPEMLVNLNSGGRQASFLKIQVSLELDNAEAVPEVEAVLPRIVDNFQVYLRELRPEELSGTKGVVRLKEELLVRVNGAIEPVRVYDILFKEILVQG